MQNLDKLHIALSIVAVVGPLLTAFVVHWLKNHGHAQAAQVLEETLRAVVRGIEVAGDPATKDAVQSEATLANVEHVLAPLVQSETSKG